VTTALNEKENRVEVYVTDRARFEGELRKANIQLPDHVELVAVAILPNTWYNIHNYDK
jgi:hypothetical protein